MDEQTGRLDESIRLPFFLPGNGTLNLVAPEITRVDWNITYLQENILSFRIFLRIQDQLPIKYVY